MAATLHSPFREPWRELKRGRPGHRFQARYHRAHCDGKRCSPARRIALVVAALICLAIAAVLAVFPGPAIPFFMVAGALLASESLIVARFMDWSELRGRQVTRWSARRWRRLPITGRIVLLILGASSSAGATYFAYRLVAG